MVDDGAKVRPARLGDVNQIARVHVDSWRETYTGLVPGRFFDDEAFQRRVRMWTRLLSGNPVTSPVFVADVAGRIVGFASAGAASGPDAEKGHKPARDLHLYVIYVLAAEHGTGVGQELLDTALGSKPAQLWVASRNARARRFYERNGFRPDGVEVIDPDLEDLIELRMVR